MKWPPIAKCLDPPLSISTVFSLLFFSSPTFLFFSLFSSGVDEPQQTGTPFRYLLFTCSRNARSGTYCQISRNAFYLPFRHLFTMGGDDDYEFMTPSSFTYLQPVSESWTKGAHFIVKSLIFGAKKKFRTVETSRYYCILLYSTASIHFYSASWSAHQSEELQFERPMANRREQS